MTSIELFNALNGKTVSRSYIEEIIEQAKSENQTAVVYRLSRVLNNNPDYTRFEMTIRSYPQMEGLAGVQHTGDYREALDDCGRLRKGWKFVKGNVVKVEKGQGTKSKGQVTKTGKNAPNVGKGYIPSENIPSENIPSENILSEEKANQPLPQTDSWRKKLKEASEKYHQEEQLRLEKEQEALEKEKTLWKKISKKDKEEIKYLEGEIKSEEAFMSSLSRDRRAVEEWIKTGDLGVFNHYKIYGADAEAVRKQYERGGIESFRSQYGLAQKRIKKHTTQIEKIKQKYAEAEKPCKTCKKSAKNVGKGHVLSEEKIRFKDLDRSEFESYEKNEMVRKKLGLGKEYQGKVYVEKYIVETYLYGAKFHKSKQDIRIGKLDDCQKIELDGRILFISKNKTLDYFTEENAEVRRKVAEEIRKKRREERKVKETENLSDYLDELYQKMLKLDPRAKPLLYQEVSKKFDIHKIQARFFHEEARKVEANFGMKKSPKGEFSDLIDSIFAVDFDRFFNERKAEGNFIRYYYTDFSNEIISYIAKRQNWKKYGLAAPQPQLSTDDFKKMTVKELREFTLQYYLENLKGKKVAVKDFIKEVVFTTKAGRKIAHGEAMYKEKAVAIEHLEQLIKNSTYNNWGDRKLNDHKEILGYLNFKSKLTIDGEKRHVRISFIFNKDREIKLKSYDVGKKKNSQVPQGVLPSAEGTQLFENKSTKKSSNRKKNDKNFGLGLPLTDEIRKKAFTDKGKLRKGWYYEENGLLTDGKEYYTSDNTLRYYGDKKNKIKTISSKKIEAIDKFISEKANKLSKEKQQFAEKLYEKIAEKFAITTKQTEYLCNRYMYSNHIHSRISLNYLEINDFRKHFGKTINRKFFTQYEKIKTRYADLYDYTFNDFSKQIIQYFIDELKKYDEKFGLGLPLTDEIRKKAFTDKGKLRKGWYYEENGILTNGKYFYISKDKKQIEYELLKEKVLDKISQKQKMKSELNNLESDVKWRNDYKLNWLNNGFSRMDFYQSLLPKLKEKILNIEKEDVWEIVENSVEDGKNGNRAFTWNGKKSKEYQAFLKQFGIKDGKAYLLNKDALFVYRFVKEAIKKEVSKVRGDREKLEKKYGLAAPVSVMQPAEPETKPSVFVEESPLTPEGETFELVNELPPVAHHRKGSLAQQLANAPEQTESYQIDRLDMAQFLGDMEIKNVDSLVITLTGGQGSGKTRFAFQFMNDLAQRYKVGHISIEEHPKSRLYKEKAYQYLNPTALNNIEAHDVRSLSEIDKIIRENDVIVIDSYQKIKEIDSKFEVDKDLRKKYNGKLFLVIFQQTSDGKMRGGSKSQFDGDIILFTEKFPNYQENYVYPDKNRYNSIPANQLKYNIFQQALLPVEPEEQTIENQVYDVIY